MLLSSAATVHPILLLPDIHRPPPLPTPIGSDLAQNALTGGLPPEWGALPSLASLDASGNYLSGGLPEAWFQLANLQELQLASNNLKVRGWRGAAGGGGWRRLGLGSPACSCRLAERPSLTHFPKQFCSTQGAIPTSWARLPSLTLLELGSNVGLCGSQPDWRAGTQV